MDVRHMMTILIMQIVDPILMYCKVLMITNTNVIVHMFLCVLSEQVSDIVWKTFDIACLTVFANSA